MILKYEDLSGIEADSRMLYEHLCNLSGYSSGASIPGLYVLWWYIY